MSSANAIESSFEDMSMTSRDRLPGRTWLLLALLNNPDEDGNSSRC